MKFAASVLLGLVLGIGTAAAADMPQKWLDAHSAPRISTPADSSDGTTACRDFSGPDSKCCAVLDALSSSKQRAFLLEHPSCQPEDSSGGDEGDSGDGGDGGNGDDGGNGGQSGGGSGQAGGGCEGPECGG